MTDLPAPAAADPILPAPTPAAEPAADSGPVPMVDRPSVLRVWLLAIRPATLPAAVAPVIVGLGVGLSAGRFRPDTALGCLVVALLLQVAANLANDLADYRSGADTPDRLGPVRVAAHGLATPRQLTVAVGLVLGLAGLVGLYLVSVGGIALLVLGTLAVVSLLGYTGGPWPYGYRGLGEAFVFVFFGLVAVIGTAYLQTGAVDALAALSAIPMGCLAAAILVVNNLRDIDTDRRAGKRTLAVILGPRFARQEYAVLLAVAFAVPVTIWIAGLARVAVVISLLAAPLAVPLAGTVFADGDPRRLNPVLKGTARLELLVAVLLALGLAVGVR